MDDYQYDTNYGFKEGDSLIIPSLEERVAAMDNDLFELFYRSLLVKLKINRHSSPTFQLKAILSEDRSTLLHLLNEIEGKTHA